VVILFFLASMSIFAPLTQNLVDDRLLFKSMTD
jgi:hypothetical protein